MRAEQPGAGSLPARSCRATVYLLVALLVALGCRQQESGPAEKKRPPQKRHVFLPPVPDEPVQVARAGPQGDSCPDGQGITVLMDGETCTDPSFHPSHGQPAVILTLQEKDGSAAILVDLGTDPRALDNNLTAWLAGRPDGKLPGHRALVLSHAHSYAPLVTGSGKSGGPAEALLLVWRVLGDLPATGPNIADVCSHARETTGPAARLCGSRARSLEPGLAPVTYADGTESERVWLFTYAISPEERAEVPFQPLESVLVIRSGEGYLVYSVCSHMASKEHGVQELHIAERVAALTASGALPPGPVHTLVTGLCGVIRTFEETGGKNRNGAFDSDEFVRRLKKFKEATGLERIYFSHCGLKMDPVYPLFQQVLGADNVHLALPGSCIPLGGRH